MLKSKKKSKKKPEKIKLLKPTLLAKREEKKKRREIRNPLHFVRTGVNFFDSKNLLAQLKPRLLVRILSHFESNGSSVRAIEIIWEIFLLSLKDPLIRWLLSMAYSTSSYPRAVIQPKAESSKMTQANIEQ